MFRSLYTKLVMILVLLIVSLMAVVGVFLINSVSQFYMNDFAHQMSSAFDTDNRNLWDSLYKAADAPAAASQLSNVVTMYSAVLGIDGRDRLHFILDGRNASVLSGSVESALYVDITPNILLAMEGTPSFSLNPADRFFDCAVPVEGAGGSFIIYIYDSRSQLETLTQELVTIIIESVLFGLTIAVMLALLLSKTMTTPIENLTRSAARVAAGDFAKTPEVQSTDEIGVLTRTFNEMSRVLQDTLEAVGSERDKLGTLFLHMTDGMLAFTRDGALLHINPAAIRMLHIPADVKPDMAGLLGDAVEPQELAGLTPPDFLEKSIEREGRHLQIFFAPFGSDAGEGGVMAVIHDITEQMRLDAVRREFVSNVSHELRTPLTNVKSYAETLTEPEQLPPGKIAEFADVIVSEADRMTRIVQDLLTLSKLDYNKMDWRVTRVDFSRMLPSVRQAMLLDAQKRGHELLLDMAEPLPEILGDYSRLEQVLFNIVSNAVAYTPDGGRIVISARSVRNQVLLEVSDNGIGIPQQDIPRLFERFYRVDKARARSMGGTGLGLSIAREIVQKHNGTITVRSRVGQGTAVTVTLPVNTSAPADGQAP